MKIAPEVAARVATAPKDNIDDDIETKIAAKDVISGANDEKRRCARRWQ